MNARTLLEELRERDVHLEAEGLRLHVDAPAEAATDELIATLHEHKRDLIKHLEWECRRLEAANKRRLVIRWAKEIGWIALHDPTTGEWHEVKASECLPSIVEAARAHHRRNKARDQAQSAQHSTASEQDDERLRRDAIASRLAPCTWSSEPWASQ